ncbi:Copper transport protein, putative [Candida maltosa Xu316]|uniref:Copper transport protein n=1 Tax=Candida maltosa (strain Xu316) TaxID=1245528 RepID=M3JTP9_CANMX|nr:Copper transport protein, putative [Candida maltosa Xu316]
MNMGTTTSMAMSMASQTISMVASATSMAMGHSKHAGHAEHSGMNMNMTATTSTNSSDSMGSMGHEMGHAMSMNMWLTNSYLDYPVVFRGLKASNGGQAFGIFVLLFAVAFFARMLEFVRNYLEEVVWKNNNYLESEQGVSQHQPILATPPKSCCTNAKENGNAEEHAKTSSCCDPDSSVDKSLSPQSETIVPKREVSFASSIIRDMIRLVLCFVPDMLAYALMLAAMTFCLVYFFAVVAGSGIGRFTAERLMEHYRIKRTCSRSGGNCC